MKILGINCMNHDAAMAIVQFDKKGPGNILWAAHSERYSKIKTDWFPGGIGQGCSGIGGPGTKKICV